MIRGLQQRRAKRNSIVNNVMLTHTNNVVFQYHSILLIKGSSDSSVKEAVYISGTPPPGWNSARCSMITLKHAVGMKPSVKPFKSTFNFWDSDVYPVTRGAALRKVEKKAYRIAFELQHTRSPGAR